MEIGRLKDSNLSIELEKIYRQRKIEFLLVKEQDEFIFIAKNESSLEEAKDIFATVLNLPKPIKLDQEWIEIKKLPMGQLTGLLMVISIAIYTTSFLPLGKVLYESLKFDYQVNNFYRIITPVFLHFGLFHILFNSLWLKDLGSIIEINYSKKWFVLIFIFSAAISNSLQFSFSGAEFGGLSGVIYAFLGFLWIRSKLGSELKYPLPSRDIGLMIIWYVICLIGLIPQVANWAHGGGLLTGMGFGLFFEKKWSLKHTKILGLMFLIFVLTFIVEFFQFKIKY